MFYFVKVQLKEKKNYVKIQSERNSIICFHSSNFKFRGSLGVLAVP